MHGPITWLQRSMVFGQLVDSFKSLLMQKREHMSQVYFSRPDLLPKPVKKKITVNMQRLVKNFGSFSSIVMNLKDIINHPKYCTAWLVLAVSKYSWYIIENIFWKKVKQFEPSQKFVARSFLIYLNFVRNSVG